MRRRYCLLSSTGASVARCVWESDERFRACLKLVIADRECGAVDFARSRSIGYVILHELDPVILSDRISLTLDESGIDYTFCFFTRLLRGNICESKGNSIFNFHPSLLPACPGMHGFEESVASGALFIGSTVHLINQQMDAGKIVMQSALPARAPRTDGMELRHQLFLQQCAQLLQVFLWAEAGRVTLSDNQVEIAGADYSGCNLHIPALDDDRCGTFERGVLARRCRMSA
jgi:phosphoribosylglycinamide formyltransferase 1